MQAQTTGTLLLIRPSRFGFNPQTAASNKFQNDSGTPGMQLRAQQEFDSVAERLQKENIQTIIVNDKNTDATPDAVFPNNWVSFHEDGKVILYPMESVLRRKERRNDVVEIVCEQMGVTKPGLIDLTGFEHKRQFLEGTGSVVFDHVNKKAFMGLSSRSHKDPFEKLMDVTGYSGMKFHTRDQAGYPIYHTNVMMSLGTRFAVVCADVIHDVTENKLLHDSLAQSDRQVIGISQQQMASFAGNLLEVKNSSGDPFILLSETALNSLTNLQRKTLEGYASLLPFSIPVIEKNGGGSIRCMVAEVFFKKKYFAVEIKITSPATPEQWEAYFDLRWRVLRAPWNQPRGSERDEYDQQEDASVHFIAVAGNKVIGAGRLQELSPGVAQLRYMAVDPGYSGKGVGRQLIQHMEAAALQKGWNTIFLQARENAVPFYKSAGYKVLEKTYLLFDQVQHYSMEKHLDKG